MFFVAWILPGNQFRSMEVLDTGHPDSLLCMVQLFVAGACLRSLSIAGRAMDGTTGGHVAVQMVPWRTWEREITEEQRRREQREVSDAVRRPEHWRSALLSAPRLSSSSNNSEGCSSNGSTEHCSIPTQAHSGIIF